MRTGGNGAIRAHCVRRLIICGSAQLLPDGGCFFWPAGSVTVGFVSGPTVGFYTTTVGSIHGVTARTVHIREVGGSSPSSPTKFDAVDAVLSGNERAALLFW